MSLRLYLDDCAYSRRLRQLLQAAGHNVKNLLERYRALAAAQLSHEKRLLQQQIAVTDKAIDALVYALYGLTPEEIAIVEGAAT